MSSDEKKLYVGGLPFRHTKDDLYDMFEKYGAVQDAFIIKDRNSGRSRGFGFVIFESIDSMDDAIDALNDTKLDGRRLVVEYAGYRGPGGGGHRSGGGGGSYRQRPYQSRDRGRERDNFNDDRRRGDGDRRYEDRY